MSDLLRLAIAIAAQVSRSNPSPRPSAMAMASGALASGLAAVAAIAAMVFALDALWLSVNIKAGPVAAALCVAAALAAVCLAAIMAARAILVRPKPPKRAASGEMLASELASGAASFIKDNQSQFLMAAFVAGILAARSKH